VFQTAVDCFGGSVAGVGPVEVGEHVGGAAVECSAEGDQFGQGGRHALADRVDDRLQFGFRGGAVAISLGGDDALVDAPGGLDLHVLVVGEHRGQACALLVGEQVGAGAQHPADAVERVTGAAAVPARVLLDALAAAVQCVAGQGDDMERVHDRDRVGKLFGGGGLEAGEPVHRDDLDPVPELGCLGLQPGLEHLFGAAFDHVQQPGRPGAVTHRCQVDDHRDELVAPARVTPAVFVHAEHPHPVQAARVIDQQLLAGGQDGVVDGVPGRAEVGRDSAWHNPCVAADRGRPARAGEPANRRRPSAATCRGDGTLRVGHRRKPAHRRGDGSARRDPATPRKVQHVAGDGRRRRLADHADRLRRLCADRHQRDRVEPSD
jgi:hypothetical protein